MNPRTPWLLLGFAVVQTVLVVAKLCGGVTWSWWLVVAPMGIVLGGFALVLFVVWKVMSSTGH